MPRLSLDCLTVTDTAPEDLVRAAAAAGFDDVSLWVSPPAFPKQGVTRENAPAVAAALKDTGVGVHALEVFDLASAAALEGYRPALELGASLGARVAVAIHHTNADRSEAAALLARFAAIAAEYGLGVNLEPFSTGKTRTLAEATALIADAGADCGIVLDFLHLFRTGSGAEDIRRTPAGLIRHVQICDGPATIAPEDIGPESLFKRAWPGDGEFPIAEYLAAVPDGASLGMECPDLARVQAGDTAQAIAAEAMTMLRRARGG